MLKGLLLKIEPGRAFADAQAYDQVMSALTPEQARGYLDRWTLIREMEARELQAAPMSLKAQQLAVLMASRDLFRKDPGRELEIAGVRDRWARIRRAAGG